MFATGQAVQFKIGLQRESPSVDVECRRADPVLAGDLGRPHAAFLLCQVHDGLFLSKPRLPHVRLLVDGLSFQMRDQIGAQVPRRPSQIVVE